MSRNYDNWEKLVGAVLRREKDRQLAYCESFSSLGSADVSLRPSSASDVLAADLSARGIFASHNIMAIPFEEIRLATQNFQPDVLLGEGKFGPVFKGWFHEHFLTAVKPGFGIAVAVKKLSEREVYYLYQPRHPNLVKLIGYGFEEGSSALVYEFMPNGSLDNHLFTRGPQLLSWETRIKVAVGAARGLSFLHDLKIIVTHEGVKSSSILLDDEFNPNLSEFALTRFASGLRNIVTNDYTAPEFTSKGRLSHLTMKSDVYSFGIILLELLSGLRVLDHNRPVKDQNLVVWSKPYLSNKRKLLQIVDSRLEGQYPHDEAYTVGKLASQCLSLDPKLRPMMSEVVDTLEQLRCLNTEAKLSHSLSVGPRYPQNPREPLFPADIDIKMDGAGSSKWSVIGPVSSQNLHPSQLSGENMLFFCDVMAIEYNEIKKATKNFQPELLLGEGAFGPVYKGWLHEHYLTAVNPGSGIAVAVKKLNKEGCQGHNEWMNEIRSLRQIHHPNTIKIIGCSFETDKRILVYEFMPRGSLNNHLFRKKGYKNHLFRKKGMQETLPWATRMKVAVGAARALAFLHGLKKPLIHRYFKCSNILLDADFNPKLSDFCRAIDGPTGDRTRVEIQMMGAYGYAAPEYVATGQLTTRCDVYSFGVVLLELLSGLRVIDRMRSEGKHNLMEWAIPYLGSEIKLSRIMDRRLEGEYPPKEAYKVANIALQCTSSDPSLRPTMVEVVAALEKV